MVMYIKTRLSAVSLARPNLLVFPYLFARPVPQDRSKHVQRCVIELQSDCVVTHLTLQQHKSTLDHDPFAKESHLCVEIQHIKLAKTEVNNSGNNALRPSLLNRVNII